MEKTIKLGNKEYKMKASAFTVFGYKNEFKRDFIKDLKEIYSSFDGLDDILNDNVKTIDKSDLKDKIKDKIKDNNSLDMIDSSMDVISVLLKISYVMIKEADKSQVDSYESLLKGIDSLFSDTSWISEVIELAVSPF